MILQSFPFFIHVCVQRSGNAAPLPSPGKDGHKILHFRAQKRIRLRTPPEHAEELLPFSAHLSMVVR